MNFTNNVYNLISDIDERLKKKINYIMKLNFAVLQIRILSFNIEKKLRTTSLIIIVIVLHNFTLNSIISADYKPNLSIDVNEKMFTVNNNNNFDSSV